MDFSDLYFNLHEKDGDSYILCKLSKYKEFADFKEEGALSRDKAIRYINYLYSSGSPLIKKHRDNLWERKEEAARLAGFNLKSDRKIVEHDLFRLKDKGILKMVMRFLVMQKNILWSQIVTNEQSFFENQEIIMDPLSGDDEKKRTDAAKNKGILMEECDNILNRLKQYYIDFFGTDKDLQEAYKLVDIIMTTPEEIALIDRPF